MGGYSEVIETLIAQPTSAMVMLGVWLAAMIAVPILRWTLGAGAERIGISIGVLAQTILVATLLLLTLPLGRAIAVIIAVPVLGWASELLGSRRGVPFGRYHYTEVLQPQIGHVPLLIPMAWLMMIPPSFAVGVLIAPNNHALALLLGAGAFTAWDLYLDPQMIAWRFWEWEDHGAYLGIPIVNFFGWFVVALVIGVIGSASLGAAILTSMPLVPLAAVYVITWALELVGQALFWNLRTSAIVGGVGMGAFVVATAAALR